MGWHPFLGGIWSSVLCFGTVLSTENFADTTSKSKSRRRTPVLSKKGAFKNKLQPYNLHSMTRHNQRSMKQPPVGRFGNLDPRSVSGGGIRKRRAAARKAKCSPKHSKTGGGTATHGGVARARKEPHRKQNTTSSKIVVNNHKAVPETCTGLVVGKHCTVAVL